MTRRAGAIVGAAVLVAAVAVGGWLLARSATPADRSVDLPDRPNVLLVTLDTTRSDYVDGLDGHREHTPVLSELARQAFAFPAAVSETNVTNPSHISILTGLRAIEHGVFSNHSPLPAEIDLLPAALRRTGYTTAGFLSVPHLAEIPAWRGFDRLDPVPREVLAPETTRKAARWLREHAEDEAPFFLWVHYFDPHALYRPPADLRDRLYDGDPTAGEGPRIADASYFAERDDQAAIVEWLGEVRDPEYPRALYAGELMLVDRELGRLLATLDETGRGGDTLVAVVGDHGESLGEHGVYYAHRGLYEPQLRVPLIVRVPGVAGERVEGPASVLDVAPTLAALTGARLQHATAGRNLLPRLGGESPRAAPASPGRLPAGMMVHQNAHNHGVALRDGDWKLIWPVNRKHPQFDDGPELYHLADDPGETRNLIAEHPERARQMRRILDPWIRLGRRPDAERVDLGVEQIRQLEALGYLR